MGNDYQVVGTNGAAAFTLKIHRGDGMALLAMNWAQGKPPANFVGFGIEAKEPGSDQFHPLKNRLCFPGVEKGKDPDRYSTLRSPIQKFRWIHFPAHPDLPGAYGYRVTPVFMNGQGELGYGAAQTAELELTRETCPGELNVAYTRGFVSSQAFVDHYADKGPIHKLIPSKADDGLKFKPTHPLAAEALTWMGFEARKAILNVLDQAVADTQAQVRVVAYDLNLPDVVGRLEKVGKRLKVIIDDSGTHGKKGSAEDQAEARLIKSAGAENVKRQHVGGLQHNKTLVVDGPKGKYAVCGSTNFSWRGWYVQNNNAVVLTGETAIRPFLQAFEDYWVKGTPAPFGETASAHWADLGLSGLDAKVAFSPHAADDAMLKAVADDVAANTQSSLFYSLAFLYQTPGPIKDAIVKVTKNDKLFVYGISDREVGGIALQKPDGNVQPVYPAALTQGVPEPFKSEPTGGAGVRMHHKFLVVDFDRPTARVYLGSYNFSNAADVNNGENLVLIRDRKVATSYMVQGLTMFDHYHFRILEQASQAKDAKKAAKRRLELAVPPAKAKDKAWWEEDWTDAHKRRDREMFA